MNSIIRIVKKFYIITSKHQKHRIIQLAVLMIVGGFLETMSVSLMLPFVSTVMEPEKTMHNEWIIRVCNIFNIESSRQFLFYVAILLALVYIFKNIYLILEYNIHYRFVYTNMFAMQERLLDTLIHRPYEYYLNISSGEVIRIINNDTTATFGLLMTLLSLFSELVVSAMLIVAIFIITPVVTVAIAVLLLALLFVINFFLKPVMRREGMNQQKAGTGMMKWLLQSIQGIKELKVMGKERYFQDNYQRYGTLYIRSLRRSQTLSSIPRFLIEAISMSAFFFIVAVLIGRGGDITSIVPILSSVAMAALRLMPSINRISTALAQVSYNEPMLDELISNLKVLGDTEDVSFDMKFEEVKKNESKKIFPKLSKEIELSGIYYRYPNTEQYVLENADISIKKGDSVGIVGASGAGKTTLVDIILGLLSLERGAILVDGEDISNNIDSWHGQIGYIPQMIFMLDDTIRANVAFGIDEEKRSDEAVWKALHEAAIDDFVRGLPKGLDTEIGERGLRLSGGQRQRIGIARALYPNPSVLIFDEATSSLDSETEIAIMDSINRLHRQKTIIIIAHRLTTIEGCDHVFRVSNGKISIER